MTKTVKDLLVEIKDTSELMVDLAYSAVLYDNEDIAEEVVELESRLINLLREIRTIATLSARGFRDAKQITSVLQIATAAQKIGCAAADISSLILRGYKLPSDVVNLILAYSEETILKVVVPESSQIVNKKIGDVKLHTVTGMRVLAIKRDLQWIFNVDRETKILKGDVLFVRGDPNAVPKFYEFVFGEKVETPSSKELEIPELDMAVDTVIQMKNLSELAVDLAYSSLLYGNDDVALEVVYLENIIDNMKFDVMKQVLKAAKEIEPGTLIPILELAHCSEQIADAAREICEVLLNKMELPSIFVDAMRESDEVITMISVSQNSPLHGKTLGETKVETNTGMHVVAVKRKNDWITRPTANTYIFGGDVLIAKGPRDGEKELVNLCCESLPRVKS